MSVTKLTFLPLNSARATIHIFPFDLMLNTPPIWCLPLQHPSPCSYTSEKSQGATKLQDSITGLLTWFMTVFETMQEQEIKVLSPLFLITDCWLLALHKPLDSTWSWGTVIEAWLYCVPLSANWELKPPFYFLQTMSHLASVGREVQGFG